MKLLRIVPFAFLLSIGLVGCGKAKEQTPAEKAVSDMEAAATAACACPKGDAHEACFEKALDAANAPEEILKKEFPDKEKIPADLKKRMEAMATKAEACAKGDAPPTTGAGTGTGSAALSEDDQVLADLVKMGETICACPDQACFDAEAAKVEPMMEKIKALPADKQTKVDEVKKSVEACATKLGGGGGPTPPPTAGGDAEAVLKEFEALQDEVCKCADMACAQAAMDKGDPLEDKLIASYADGKIPDDAKARLDAVEKGAKACVEKLVP